MKNLTIKKVALGIVLAGYAASGAFALTATSSKTIIGNAPTIVAPSNASAKFEYKVMRNVSGTPTDIKNIGAVGSTDRKAQVGDVIHITIKYDDVDGDDADDLLTTTKQDSASEDVKFVIFNYDGTTAGTGISPTAVTAAVLGTNGEYTYTILPADAGKKLGINLTPVSKFGDPDIGTRIKDNNLFSAAAGGDGTTPGDDGTVVPDLTGQRAYIFHTSDMNNVADGLPNTGAIPLASTAAGVKTPTLGETYVVAVYNGANDTAAFASSNAVTATNQAGTTITWSVTGGNGNALGTITTSDYVLKTAAGNVPNSNEFTIPATNTAGLALISPAPSTAPEAGLQGFQLKADVVF